MSIPTPSHITLSELQRAALVLAGHHVPAERAATILALARASDVLDVLDDASRALGVRGYYRAYTKATALGLLDCPAAQAGAASVIRDRHRERDRRLRPGRRTRPA
jgi:hypothetical protein